MIDSRKVRDHLHTLLTELSKKEADLEKSTDVLSKLMTRGTPQYDEDDMVEGGYLSSLNGTVQTNQAGGLVGEPRMHPESKSKLAIQTEQEIIAAIEKCKLATLESKQEQSRLQAENFDYRPEGMFPPVPKPMSKTEKLENLNRAYGPASKVPKAPLNRNSSTKIKSGSRARNDPVPQPEETVGTKKAWNAGAQGNTLKAGTKLPPKPKPSESQYSNLKPVDPNRHLRRNPEKITSSAGRPAPQPAARSSSRGAPSKPCSVSTAASTRPSAANSTNAPVPSACLPPPPLQPAAAAPSPPSPPRPAASLVAHPPVSRRAAVSPGAVDGLGRALALFRRGAPAARTGAAKDPALGAAEVRLLQLVQKAKDRAQGVFQEYMSTKAAEAKRQGIEAASQKLMFRMRLQTAYWEEWISDSMNKKKGHHQHLDNEQDENDQANTIPVLTKAVIDIRDVQIDEVQQAIDLIYCSSSEWKQLDDSDELVKLYKLRREGYMDKSSEAYLDMISLLQSAKGLKSTHGQDILGDMYSIWYFSDQFVDRYNNLKEAKAQLDELKSRLLSTIFTKKVVTSLENIIPLRSSALDADFDQQEHLQEALSVTSKEDTTKFVETTLKEYLCMVESVYLPGLKSQLMNLKNSKDGWESPKYQKDLGAFLMQLQSVDKLMKLNSTLPLIFHQNAAEEL